MRDQIEDLEVIAAVARDLAGVTHAEAARPAICKAGARLTEASLVVLYEPDPKGLELVPTAVFGARERLAYLPSPDSPRAPGPRSPPPALCSCRLLHVSRAGSEQG